MDQRSLFSSKLESHARALDLDIRRADPELAPKAVLAFVSLIGFDDAWQNIVQELKRADARLPIVGFGPHTDAALMKRARRLGCDKVVANSAFASELASLIGRYARTV